MSESDDRLLVFNGVNAATGEYLLPPLSAEVISKIARGEKMDPKHLAELKWRYTYASKATLGVKAGVDATKLEETGWGVIFPHNSPPAIRDALLPLLERRQSQAGKYYKEYSGPLGYRPNESKLDFLARNGAGPGPADPEKVPYYLLIVGDPEAVPFRFQYLLDVQYAVGRIWFDTVQAYANYAQSVVIAETRPLGLRRKVVFFAPQNPGDEATALSSTELAAPLAADLVGKLKSGSPPWEAAGLIGETATKPALTAMLGGANTPAVLFTASHGVGFPNGDPRQLRHQGALLCQEWPGPSWDKPIPEAQYFSADDLASSANPFGLIAFFFACYGAGTPRLDDFVHQAFLETRPALAPQAFLAGLPRQLLCHTKGGALAVVGHVDRAWGYSFHWEKAGRQLAVFESTLKQLLDGYPVGAALEFFNERYSELSTSLSDELEEIKYGKAADVYALAGLWTANNDSRSYVVIGDPAVRVAVPAPGQTPQPRPSLILADPSPPLASATAPSFSPGATSADPAVKPPASLLSVLAATEQRFRDQAAAPHEPTSYRAGLPPVVQVNSPLLVRKRLARLGVPAAEIDSLLSQGRPSFAIIRRSEAPSSALVALERIIGRNDLIGVEFLASAMAAARSVGRVVIRNESGKVVGYGSGAMVSPRLFLTNNHVVETASWAASSAVDFGYAYAPGGHLQAARTFTFAPGDFFLTDPKLDFTLVAVAAGNRLADFGWLTLNDDDGAVLKGEYVNIVQHPNGWPMQVALRDNLVTDILADFLHYRADTEPGSSGAPVFNDQWELIGLHHSGVPKKNDQGQILARNGQVWTDNMGEAAIDWIANEGIRVGRILAYLRDAPLSDTQKAPRDELLSAVVTQPATPRPAIPIPSEGRPMPADTARGEQAATTAPGGVTVNVPIHIAVSLGGAGVPSISVTAPGAAPAVEIEPGEAISIDPDYDTRAGYDESFLGTGALAIQLPQLPDELLENAAKNQQAEDDDDPHELKYHHFSVVLNRRRRLAFFTAVNIDGRSAKSPKRDKDKWFFDPRVRKSEQVGHDIYGGSMFDRGHLVRRLDPAWGSAAAVVKTANDDTFHFTNCSTQHKRFNEGKNLWAGLEDYLLNKASTEGKRLTVFTGPVFRDDDPEFRGVQIPREFWKVAVYAKKGEGLVATAFLVSQEKLIRPVVEEAAAEQVAKTFQTTVAKVIALTGLDFGELTEADVMARPGVSFVPGETTMVELSDESKIRVE
jgi:DNA/RNA endonuclease G (NUC1)/V8-like Glu-specific endopeptidase